MFLIDKEQVLTGDKLGKIIQTFHTRDLPRLTKNYKYYAGKQAIMNKQPTDDGKPCNKVMTNYCHSIVQTYNGYLTGIDIAYTGEDLDEIEDVLKYNDVHSVDAELLRHALIAGVAYEIAYIDENGKNRFKVLDSRNVIPVYDNTLNQDLIYVIRYYKDTLIDGDEYTVEVYDKDNVYTYSSTAGFASFNLVAENAHFFGQVPITVFNLNEDNEGIFEQIITLQDAYNELQSGEVDSWDAFADAYLVFKGVQANAEDLAAAKKSRAFMLDNDSSVDYLTKDINDTQIQNMLIDINNNIHKIANCPDFSQESFGSASGIALRYRLLGFENVAANIEANMRKALQRRIELITAILNIKGNEETVWRDVKIQFTRNLPINIEETASVVNSLRGLVSDETLLSLLPFITSPQEELERIKTQQEANAALYSFPNSFPSGTDEEQDDLNG